MSRNTEPTEIWQITQGVLLLLLCHILAGALIFGLGLIASPIWGGYGFLAIWIVGAVGFFFWQLLYVIPLSLWLKRRGKVGMMKGVIIGAVITALLNGACFLAMGGFR
jgi:hypothetical protein